MGEVRAEDQLSCQETLPRSVFLKHRKKMTFRTCSNCSGNVVLSSGVGVITVVLKPRLWLLLLLQLLVSCFPKSCSACPTIAQWDVFVGSGSCRKRSKARVVSCVGDLGRWRKYNIHRNEMKHSESHNTVPIDKPELLQLLVVATARVMIFH